MGDYRDALLVLEDGRTFRGTPLGARGRAFGEVVFNTSMTGYQEIFSDPSYRGQLVCLTAPQVGNYGVCAADEQAPSPAAAGVVVREYSPFYSGHRAEGDLESWMVRHGLVGISEVDTRALTRHIRQQGAMRGGIFTEPPEVDPVELVRRSPKIEGRDLTGEVGCDRVQRFGAGEAAGPCVVVVDFGVKRGIVQRLVELGLEVVVVPGRSSAEQVLEHRPAGVVLSNGPGDPAAVGHGIKLAAALAGKLPLLGICLGHQLLSLGLGARTYKLRFGHHGGNHPVRDCRTERVMITAQNHGFAVDASSLEPIGLEPSHLSLYDGTVEGIQGEARRILSVQFHPEDCPGPHDAREIFERFRSWLEV